jgi:hypothetical protein
MSSPVGYKRLANWSDLPRIELFGKKPQFLCRIPNRRRRCFEPTIFVAVPAAQSGVAKIQCMQRHPFV